LGKPKQQSLNSDEEEKTKLIVNLCRWQIEGEPHFRGVGQRVTKPSFSHFKRHKWGKVRAPSISSLMSGEGRGIWGDAKEGDGLFRKKALGVMAQSLGGGGGNAVGTLREACEG